MKNYIILLPLVLISFTSCDNDDNDQPVIPTIQAPVLSISCNPSTSRSPPKSPDLILK